MSKKELPPLEGQNMEPNLRINPVLFYRTHQSLLDTPAASSRPVIFYC